MNLPPRIATLIAAYLEKITAGRPCPTCGGVAFILADVIGYVAVGWSTPLPDDPYAYLAAQNKYIPHPTARGLPVVPMVCTSCGHVREYAFYTLVKAAAEDEQKAMKK